MMTPEQHACLSETIEQIGMVFSLSKKITVGQYPMWFAQMVDTATIPWLKWSIEALEELSAEIKEKNREKS